MSIPSDIEHLFDNDDDDDDGDGIEGNGPMMNNNNSTTRSQENGVLQFHNGTEEMMWLYICQQTTTTTDRTQRRIDLLTAIDEFCYQRHWMMHCGPMKGDVLAEFLRDRILQHNNAAPFHVVELGTYCGYSLLRMAHEILSFMEEDDGSNSTTTVPPFHITTIDILAPTLARKLWQRAGLDDSHVTFLTLTPDTTLDTLLLQESNTKIDFLFVDHDKELYLSDLQTLEQAQLIQAGTAVVADNVVVFCGADISPYRQYLQDKASKEIVTTQLVRQPLEYTHSTVEKETYPDGMELTVYLQDP